MMKQVMSKAWEIAREGVKKFGGKVKEYFAEALRMAWSIVKGQVEKVQLVGSPKQIAWAEDLRNGVKVVYELLKENNLIDYDEDEKEDFEIADKVIQEILNSNSAKFYIDKFSYFNVRKLKQVLASDYEYKHFEVERIVKDIDFQQFEKDFQDADWGLMIVQASLRNIVDAIPQLQEKLK